MLKERSSLVRFLPRLVPSIYHCQKRAGLPAPERDGTNRPVASRRRPHRRLESLPNYGEKIMSDDRQFFGETSIELLCCDTLNFFSFSKSTKDLRLAANYATLVRRQLRGTRIAAPGVTRGAQNQSPDDGKEKPLREPSSRRGGEWN